MKIRSITSFANPGWPLEANRLSRVGSFLKSAASAFADAGYEVQTTRLATPPFPLLVYATDLDQVVDYAAQIEQVADDNQIDYVSIGPALPEHPASYNAIPTILGATERVFVSGMTNTQGGEVCLECVKACARAIHANARLEADGFANLRFAALATVSPGAPFFPAAYAYPGIESEEISFSIATEAADLAVDAIADSASLSEARRRLVLSVEEHASRMEALAQNLGKQSGFSFAGFDFTLAPFPTRESSIGTALEKLGVPVVGKHGTLAAVVFLADALDRARFPRAGFNGLMLPVLEDSVLASRAADGNLSLVDLLLYSTVCGTGLDTVPLPGNIPVDSLYAVLLDLAMLSQRLRKPLTARLMPVPGKSAGDETVFDFPYFANSRVMGAAAETIGGYLAGDEMVGIQDRPLHTGSL